jgi:hypothetical protein
MFLLYILSFCILFLYLIKLKRNNINKDKIDCFQIDIINDHKYTNIQINKLRTYCQKINIDFFNKYELNIIYKDLLYNDIHKTLINDFNYFDYERYVKMLKNVIEDTNFILIPNIEKNLLKTKLSPDIISITLKYIGDIKKLNNYIKFNNERIENELKFGRNCEILVNIYRSGIDFEQPTYNENIISYFEQQYIDTIGNNIICERIKLNSYDINERCVNIKPILSYNINGDIIKLSLQISNIENHIQYAINNNKNIPEKIEYEILKSNFNNKLDEFDFIYIKNLLPVNKKIFNKLSTIGSDGHILFYITLSNINMVNRLLIKYINNKQKFIDNLNNDLQNLSNIYPMLGKLRIKCEIQNLLSQTPVFVLCLTRL